MVDFHLLIDNLHLHRGSLVVSGEFLFVKIMSTGNDGTLSKLNVSSVMPPGENKDPLGREYLLFLSTMNQFLDQVLMPILKGLTMMLLKTFQRITWRN